MKKKKLVISIIVMLMLAAVSSVWIVQRHRAVMEARAVEAEQREKELEKKRAEEEAAAKKEAEDAAVASHVYSHRGSAGPDEHSFRAYDAAIEAGSRYIEPDIVISSDGVLYVSHDLSAASMTGVNSMYEYLDSETVDGLETYSGNKVLRLSDVFDRYGDSINYVIEIKPYSDACTEAFGEMVDEYGLADVITVQSVYPEVLEKLETRYPDMPKLFVCKSQYDFEYYVDAPYIDILSVKASAGLMTEGNCQTAHENGKMFSAWTLDSEEEIKSAIDMGVDTYFTNDTPLALSLEREYGLEARGESGY